MAGPQYEPTPGLDQWAANLRAAQQAAAANQGGNYVLDPSLVAARDAARQGLANANGVGQTIGAGAAGVGKIIGAAGDLVSNGVGAAGAAIRGFGSDIAAGYRGGPAPAAPQTGGASGDWVGAPAAAVPNNAVAPAPQVTQAAAPTAPRPNRAPSGQPSAAGAAPAAPSTPEYTPVSVIRGSRLGQEYTVEDQEKMAAAGMAPARGGVGYGPVGAGGFGLTNPQSAIDRGFDRQATLNDAIFANAANYGSSGDIFENKQRSALAAHLAGAMIGNNNQGQVQGQGVNTMNQVAGGVQSAGIGAGAQIYGANAGLQGHLANVAEQHFQAATGSVPLGTVLQADPVTGMSVPTTTYGQRPSQVGGMPTPYQQPKSQYQPGLEYTNPSGKRAVYQKDGTWKEAK